MPELPEVETIRRELAACLHGARIVRVRVLRSDVVGHPGSSRFANALVSAQIEAVDRQGKYLILGLRGGRRLIFHLRLSGGMCVTPDPTPQRFARVLFYLSDGRVLQFVEPRVLGRVYLTEPGEKPKSLAGLFNLGLEPLAPDFSTVHLGAVLAKRKARIKSLLLDQRIAAGVGNIYSDEALFRARIRPTRRAHTLTRVEIARLVRTLKNVIREGIDNLGTSVRDYHRTDGGTGNYQEMLRVYGREGEPCLRCGAPIRLLKFGNRGSRYCPHCQK